MECDTEIYASSSKSDIKEKTTGIESLLSSDNQIKFVASKQNFESEIIEKQPKNSQKMIHEKIEKDMAENKQKIEHRNRINSNASITPHFEKSDGLRLIRSAYSDLSPTPSSSGSPASSKKRLKMDEFSNVLLNESSGSVAKRSKSFPDNSINRGCHVSAESNYAISRYNMKFKRTTESEVKATNISVRVNSEQRSIMSSKNIASRIMTNVQPSTSTSSRFEPYNIKYIDYDRSGPGSIIIKKKFDNGIKTNGCHLDLSSRELSGNAPRNGSAFHNKMKNNGISNGLKKNCPLSNGSVVKGSARHGIYKNYVRNTFPCKRRFKIVDEKEFERQAKFPEIDLDLVCTWDNYKYLPRNGRYCGAGLRNRKNHCFLNVVLQIITHTPTLARYLTEQHLEDRSNGFSRELMCCFTCELGRHIMLSMENESTIVPSWIYPFVKRVFPGRADDDQEDAHEFLTLLLDALQRHHNFGKDFEMVINPSAIGGASVADQVFGGVLLNRFQCSSCAYVSENYERFRELNVAIGFGQTLTLEDLIGKHFGSEILTFHCAGCKKKVEARRETFIVNVPNVLIVQLKRFDCEGQKISQSVDFGLKLRLDRFMFDQGSIAEYSLNGLIQHFGLNITSGHYVAVVRGLDSISWHFFDDENHHSVGEPSFRKYDPYVLFYTQDFFKRR